MTEMTTTELKRFDEWLATHLRTADKVSREIVTAVVIAAGGKVDFTADQIANLLDGNMRISSERTEFGYRLKAFSRPRCEKCGRWEPCE